MGAAAHARDPVEVLGLEGRIIGSAPCVHMVPVSGFLATVRRRHQPCGQWALVVEYPYPFGIRTSCEDGHVVIHPTPPVPVSTKGETD